MHCNQIYGDGETRTLNHYLAKVTLFQLSYVPVFLVLSRIIRWRLRDSNSWPSRCQQDALPTELSPHRLFLNLVSYFVPTPRRRIPPYRHTFVCLTKCYFFQNFPTTVNTWTIRSGDRVINAIWHYFLTFGTVNFFFPVRIIHSTRHFFLS